MQTRIKRKERRTITLSPSNLEWIDLKAREYGISRSEFVDRFIGECQQREKEQKMEAGYKALGDILKKTARVSLSLQKKVIPDY